MKKRKNSIGSRIVAILISLVLVSVMIPVTVSATETTATTNLNGILNLENSAPSDYSATGENPYGSDAGEDIQLVTENEYLMYISAPSDSSVSRILCNL